ncbi:MAG: PCRF domain-containing protein, partial [Butyricicoccaceae bacterium]
MLEQLEGLADRFDELESLLASPELYSDPARAAALLREQKELAPIIEAYRTYADAVQTQSDALELSEDSDPEVRAMAQEELAAARADIERLEGELRILLLPKDE